MAYVTVASSTLTSVPLDFKGNLARIRESIHLAKAKGAELSELLVCIMPDMLSVLLLVFCNRRRVRLQSPIGPEAFHTQPCGLRLWVCAPLDRTKRGPAWHRFSSEQESSRLSSRAQLRFLSRRVRMGMGGYLCCWTIDSIRGLFSKAPLLCCPSSAPPLPLPLSSAWIHQSLSLPPSSA